MSITWPWALAVLLAVPLLLVVRWWMARRRRRLAVRVASLAVVRAALPGRAHWSRRIPLFLFAAGLIVLSAGAARPSATVLVPYDSTSILLTIDVSSSMCSTDVEPNRLTAARDAAKRFVTQQKSGTRIGIVVFSGISALLVAPTTDKDALLKALDTLRTARGTAIGQGILTALDAIAEINPNVPPTGVDPAGTGPAEIYEPDTIVVLTDGANTQGVDPVTAAEQAQLRRVRVYTIGFGTTEPAPMVCSPDQIGEPIFRDPTGRFGGGRRTQEIDEETLTQVADTTGGKYFRAEDAAQLDSVLSDLPHSITAQPRKMELTVWFVLAGALLLSVAVGLSVWWNRSLTVPVARRPAGQA